MRECKDRMQKNRCIKGWGKNPGLFWYDQQPEKQPFPDYGFLCISDPVRGIGNAGNPWGRGGSPIAYERNESRGEKRVRPPLKKPPEEAPIRSIHIGVRNFALLSFTSAPIYHTIGVGIKKRAGVPSTRSSDLEFSGFTNHTHLILIVWQISWKVKRQKANF